MAHQVESMFYRGQTPWHGLGRRVFDAISTEEAIKQAGLDWTVKLQPIYLADGTEIKSAQAITRESDGSELGTVGPRYTPLQNKEAFEWFDPLVSSGLVEMETAGSLQDGKKVWLLAKIAGSDLGIVGDDIVRKYILLSNSHDGTTAVRCGFTPVRVVCANTLAMAHRTGARAENQLIRLKHCKSVVANLNSLRDVINLANQTFEATADQYRLLAQRQINAKDLERYVKVVLGYNADAPENEISTRAKDQVATVVRLFETGAGQDLVGVKGTVWAAYNAVTEYLSHEAGQSPSNRYDSLWFGKNGQRNQTALMEALKLAA